ncbi:MAG: DUF3488 domain-containing protein [Deltaproteobacteria bacterium]|nr:DUF3488 domain-containing protein [Deltaproteobacteria bacterium]
MSFTSIHKLVTYLLAGIGLASLALGGAGPLAIVAALSFVASIFAEGPRIATPRWRNAWTAATVLVLVLVVVWTWMDGGYFEHAVGFAAFLQVNRLFNRRSAREYQQIAVLAFVHLLAATALSIDLAYALCFMAFVVVAPWVLALTHLRREIEGNYPSRQDGRPAADVARVLASRRVIGGSFLAGTAALGVPLFFVTASVFLLFPRVGLGMLTFGRHSPRQTAGFSDRIELGGFGVIRDDPTVVLRVAPPGMLRVPPPIASIRLRGTAFDHYDGRRWRRTLGPGAVVLTARGAASTGTYPLRRWPRPGDRTWSLVLDPLDEPVVFLPPDAVAVRVPTRTEGGYPAHRTLRKAEDDELRYVGHEELPLAYDVLTQQDPAHGGSPSPLDAIDRERYLQMPSRHTRVVELASRLTARAATPIAKADAIEAHLLRMRYTTELPYVGANELPLEVFLFRARAGHCEYFASAMVVMLRAVGIPARNVTGFLGGRFNEYGRYYAIRQGDAHSWVELWDGSRWVVRDPTPPMRGALGPEETALSGVEALLDALRTEWRRSVVGYDLTAQIVALRRTRRFFESLSIGSTWGTSRASERGVQQTTPTRWGWVVAVLIVALVAAGVLFMLRRRRGTTSSGAASGSRAAREASTLYRELENALERHGFRRAPSTTPLELVEQLESARFSGTDVARDVTKAYLGARFGDNVLAANERDRLRARIRSLGSRR